ncbi:Signal transduction histidine kinase [Tardiphaga sp. OK246]|jgi:signal transduction histidine kinase|uniref:sensor histidine kinase n=1 Tax=Tardiphaga sp. OK246 TaxID=1855307 RepID=UPI000B6DF146|nr:HAMP domain-containing sensor histidine kinase [Tardiphaga sp. OK246]SNT11181.1 Signal transduction histidine kinase [Tardiphaga sp. OK246]
MNRIRGKSLRWLLVSRLVGLQALMLTGLVLTIVGVLWGGGYIVSLEPEDETINVIENAIARDQAGAIILRDTPALARQRARMPELWFLVRDKDGHRVSQGNVPPEFARIGDALDDVGQARLGWNIGDAPRATARMRWVGSAAGRVQILTGSGGTVPWHRVAAAIATLFLSVVLPILAVMALTTLVATPIVVRRALLGLGHAAAQAKRIDTDKRGARLTLDQVPNEIVPLVVAINDALRRLDEGFDRRQRFLVDAAHELRTPIAILQTRIESTEPGPHTTRLIEDVRRLSTLADQLLDTERLKQTAAPQSDIDLVEVAQHVTSDLAPLAIAAGYEIAFESSVKQAPLSGDQGALERALANLIHNAIEYGGRRGKIVVSVTASSVSVTDEGPGIPLNDRERVFEPFYRLNSGSRGAGLGLNLVREIVRLHDGMIDIQDGPNGGTRVTMAFGRRHAQR